MKLKTFLIAFLGSLLICLGAAAIVYQQLNAVQAVVPRDLTEKLYDENTRIMALVMHQVTPDSISNLKLPGSWAELMVVNNDSLMIAASSNAEHKGQYLHQLPNLLDQAKGIMTAMQGNREITLSTADYRVAVRPLDGNLTLIGLKPKAWERGLISAQNTSTQQSIQKIRLTLMIFLGGSLLAALLIALMVTLVTGKSIGGMVKALEELSLGNLEASPPSSPGSFATSFLRIKASLSMALDRLGD